MVSNTVDAVEHSGGFFKEVFDYFRDEDDEDSEDTSILGRGGVVLILVVAAAISVGLTYMCWSRGRLRAMTIEIDEARERAVQGMQRSLPPPTSAA
jgi:hypothetical protein